MNAWSQTYQLMGAKGLHVLQKAGPVRIVGVEGNDVQVSASCADEIDVPQYIEVSQNGSRLTVEVKSRGWGWGSTPSIRLDLQVPVGTTCHVESGAGPVEIAATAGPVRIETGSGDVKVADVGHTAVETGSGGVQGRNIRGSASAETGSGAVEFTSVDGALSIEVGSGSVLARQVRGDLRVDTGSGGLRVEDVSGRVELDVGAGGVTARGVRGASFHLDSGGGPVQLRGLDVASLEVEGASGGVDVELLTLYPGGAYEVTTGSGGVVVALPPTADVRLRAEASSGRISRTGLNFQVVREDGGELEAVLNQGRADLRIEAGSGGIRLVPCDVPAKPLSEAGARVVESVKGDPALETSEQLRRIVTMVEEGKLTPQEAEELLRAFDEEEPA